MTYSRTNTINHSCVLCLLHLFCGNASTRFSLENDRSNPYRRVQLLPLLMCHPTQLAWGALYPAPVDARARPRECFAVIDRQLRQESGLGARVQLYCPGRKRPQMGGRVSSVHIGEVANGKISSNQRLFEDELVGSSNREKLLTLLPRPT